MTNPDRFRRWSDPAGRNAWGWVLAAGIVLLIGGVCAILAPGFTTVALSVLIGWILLFCGIAGIVMGIRAHSVHRRWMDLLYGVVSLLFGLFILFFPLAGAAGLSLAFVFWLALRAGIELGGAIRAGRGRMRGSLILLGVVDALLAILLLFWFPFGTIAVIGLFVGISLLLGGIMTIVAAFGLRRMRVA
ncbi:MAG TPA: DUF308 domain-containing protein [Sphingomonas sp.]|nr:DUF308 domain-containing protein [Sphingomonas sp.]